MPTENDTTGERETIYDHHPFNFGIWRRAAPVADAENDAEAEATDGTPTAIADGGVAVTTDCPSCTGDLVNVQGVPACCDCDWTAR
ncbi:hypothetical protein [Haloarchaeobius litoreus]|uniref:Small CPxCG-related zinc finger protein n=1 Tax=Haloarchaeobius litoreus TaxID=755306 RepID=A0ABD6DJB5_9EURY|nr:hypothetical protein [Haloarchaeobius litoreus]